MTESAPDAIYGHEGAIQLRIATGGSGQSGLLEALALAFIDYCIQQNQTPPFRVAWYKSDTTFSIENLRKKVADIGITYHAVAEKTALDEEIIDKVVYAWRDHWMLVGPKDNPAKLPDNGQSTVYSSLTKLFSAMEGSKTFGKPIKFLSRYDKSAGNIVESFLWAIIGQVPWAEPPTSWYNMFSSFPFEAITEAAKQSEYTITDKGTWLTVKDKTGYDVADKLQVFAEGKDEENDPLLNPAHVLVGTEAQNKGRANNFANWMTREDGGQKVIKSFKNKAGKVLYSTIPVDVDPLDRVKGLLGFAPSVKAAVPVAYSEDEIYFFKNSKYVRINTITDTISYSNEKDIWSMWPALYQTGFSPVNASFAAPDNPREAYFFNGSRCVRVDLWTGQLAANGGPFNFHNKWSDLKEAVFETVDATIPFGFKGAGYENVVCFIYQSKYALIDVSRNVSVESGNLASRFKALENAKFRTVDAVVFKPRKNKREAYFFSGTQYVLVDLPDDRIAWGPLDVADSWKSLKAAGFY